MSILGRHGGGAKPNVKAGLNIDVEAVKKLDKELAAVKKTVDALADSLTKAADESGRLAANTSGTGTGTTNGMVTTGTNSSQKAGSGGGGGGGGGGLFGGLGGLFGGGGGGGMGGMGSALGMLGAAAGIGTIGGMAMGAIDQRVDRNRGYALTASRAGVEMQLRTGMSEMQYMKYRQQVVGNTAGSVQVDPTAMIGFENRTGISALQQRQSVGAIRALSGYSMGTEDVLGIMQQNLDPNVANMQFNMMGGMSMYGPGGEPREYMDLLKQRVNMFQLNDRTISKGAMRQGSISRYRMGMAGIGADEQDLLIQYGQAESTYRENGGRGRFDPSNREHRKIAGVEETFATQFDESQRLETKREEDMYRRQADNYADLERSNQSLIKALNSLEERLSGLIGARTSNRNWMKMGGRLLQGAGLVTMAATGWTGVGAAVGAGMVGVGTAASGDPGAGDPKGSSSGVSAPGVTANSSSANDDKIKIPYGYGGKHKSLSEVKRHSDFMKLHPTMQQRLLAMFRENPNVGIGDSHRDPKEQERMFLDRYRPDPNGDVTWRGQKWKRVKGAAAAPPGRSMHEIGLASDLVGDLKWMNANAHRFGLKHFAGVNNEPWHVQPIELPNSRRKYEEAGAAWGTDTTAGQAYEDTEPGSPAGGGEVVGDGGGDTHSGGGGGSTAADFTGMSIQQIIDTYIGGGESGGGAGGGGSRSRKEDIGNTSPTEYGDGYAGVQGAENFDGPVSSGAEAAARAAFQAGFRGDELATVVAIAGRESGWKSDAVNPNTSDRGMWQINWANFKKDYYKDFRKSVGISGINDLLNVNKNAAAAYKMYQDSVREGRPWFPWRASDEGYKGVRGWDPDGDHMWHTEKFQGEAAAAAAQVMQSGDPVEKESFYTPMPQSRPVPSRGGIGITNQYHVEFRPEFRFEGMPDNPQLEQVAREAAMYLREQVDIAMKRSS